MQYHEIEAVRAPLYGIGGLLGIMLMALLFAGFPEIRWFCFFSLPLGGIFAIAFRYYYRFIAGRQRRIIWTREVPRFHWPHPIS